MPAYNEEQNVRSTIQKNIKTFSSLGLDYEIIIVNDHSVDNTGQIADELAQKHSVIQVFHHPTNQGPGEAFKTGIAHSEKEYVILAPFDNPLSLEDMQAYLPRIGVCDIVVGVRVTRVGYSWITRFASFFYNRIMIPLLFNIGVSDANWIQIYRRRYFEDKTLTIGNSKIFFLVELLVQARRNKLIIAEVPSRMKRRLHGRAMCTRFSVIWETFWSALRYFWKINREP